MYGGGGGVKVQFSAAAYPKGGVPGVAAPGTNRNKKFKKKTDFLNTTI